MSNAQLAALFTLQLAVILGVCRGVGFLARKVGQPQVVGEMIAGVLLGPSLFGLLLPGLQQQLFPKGGMSIIYTFSQIGLVLYMFLIGAEFDTNLIRQRLRSAASVSLAGALVPLVLGSLLALPLVHQTSLFSKHVLTWEAMLFLGAAISITAFPMLARIIFERGLAGTSLGTLALAAGGLVNTWLLWGITLLVLLTALLGKGVACWLAALLNREPNREALAIGTLMNARGLIELILLNIGLEQGIITPTLFTILVLMAIVTTLMASPIFELVYGRYRKKNPPVEDVTDADHVYATTVRTF